MGLSWKQDLLKSNKASAKDVVANSIANIPYIFIE